MILNFKGFLLCFTYIFYISKKNSRYQFFSSLLSEKRKIEDQTSRIIKNLEKKVKNLEEELETAKKQVDATVCGAEIKKGEIEKKINELEKKIDERQEESKVRCSCTELTFLKS